MAATTRYPPGAPAWVDLSTSDPAAARDFYGALFGWQFDIGPEETGRYTMCLRDGAPVAGLNGQPAPAGVPTGWVCYLATDDADASARSVTEHGGQLMMGPLDVGPAGRVAVAVDPTGALFGLWQAGEHPGAAVVDEPGTVTWNELVTGDLERAQAFYSAVCGHTWADEHTGEGGPTYRTFALDGQIAGGAMQAPDGVAAHWLTYFAVADTDAAVAATRRNGGVVRTPVTPTRYGPFAALSDPQGGPFAVIARPAAPAE